MKISCVVEGEYMKISCADPEIFFRGGGVQRSLEFDGEGGSEAYIW